MLINRKILYPTIIISAILAYVLFSYIQKQVTAQFVTQLYSIKSFETHKEVISDIQSRHELGSKGIVTKDDYLIYVDGKTQPYRTYTKPKGNPEGFNFQHYFREQLNVGDEIYVTTFLNVIDQRPKFIKFLFTQDDYTLLFDIHKNDENSNDKFYKKNLAIQEYNKPHYLVQAIFIGLILAFCTVFAVYITNKK